MLTSQLEITREELRSVTDALCIVEASNVVSYATHTSGLHGFHINRLRVLKLCAFWPTESLYFPCQKHLGIKLQAANTLFEKTCHEAPTQQGRGLR